jgi:hypothetical protein
LAALSLLEAGAAPDSYNERGDSALEIASTIGAVEVVAVLLESDVQFREHTRERALLAAMKGLEGLAQREGSGRSNVPRNRAGEQEVEAQILRYSAIARALVQQGADPDWRSESGEVIRVLAERLERAELLELTNR